MRVCVLCLVCLYRRRDSGGAQKCADQYAFGHGYRVAWVSAVAGFVGLLVRWHESYLLRPDAGHIPVSNLYEVFILFLVITALMYLYYEAVLPYKNWVASSSALWRLWSDLSCGTAFHARRMAIQPLIPALQSWWMKIPRSGQLYRLRRILYRRHAGYCRTVGTQKRRCRQKNHGAAISSY